MRLPILLISFCAIIVIGFAAGFAVAVSSHTVPAPRVTASIPAAPPPSPVPFPGSLPPYP